MRRRQEGRWGFRFSVLLIAASLAPATPQAPDAKSNADAVRGAAQAKINAATEILAMCREFLIAPPGERGAPAPLEVAEQIQYWSRQLTDARLEAAEGHDDRMKILGEALDRAKGYEAEVKDLAGNEASGLTKISFAKATFYRADCEARLIRERVSGNDPGKQK